jgi:hypothetical protein
MHFLAVQENQPFYRKQIKICIFLHSKEKIGEKDISTE